MKTIDRTHIFVCVNKKNQGKCCQNFSSESMYEYIREELNRKRELIVGRNRIKAVKTSCLGNCAFGPNIFISPDNIWYSFSSVKDLDEIIDVHFIQNKILTRLVNTGVIHESKNLE